MEIIDENGNLIKVPTINPLHPIDRFKTQSKLAKYLNKHFITQMDYYTNVRSIPSIIILAYLLGKNLNWYLKLEVLLHIYIIIYRYIRFWIERWLMFLIDICYIGNYLLFYIILFNDNNRDLFIAEYSIASGIISLAVVVCDNQADISNTDYLSSCSIHVLPFMTVWAIRWKHKLYHNDIFEGSTLVSIGEVSFKFDDTFFKLIKYPYFIWFGWAIFYFIMNAKVLRKFAFSNYYESAVGDFYKSDFLPQLFGDHKIYTVPKFLLMHFIFLIIVTPLPILNFYSFYFNTAYLIFIFIFLGYNQARKTKKQVLEIVKNAEKIE